MVSKGRETAPSPSSFNGSSVYLQKLKGFAVTAPLQEMAQLRVDPGRKTSLEMRDPFRNLAQTLHVTIGGAAAFFVADDGESFAESRSEVG